MTETIDRAPANDGRRARRKIALTVGIATLTLVALGVWPVPALWQGTQVTQARVLFRPASLVADGTELQVLGAPAEGAVAATIFLRWQEPLRLRDSCLTRASVTMPPGWALLRTFEIDGQTVAAGGDPATVVAEQTSDAERFLRPTFVSTTAGLEDANAQLPSPTARIERVCDGSVASSASGTFVIDSELTR